MTPDKQVVVNNYIEKWERQLRTLTGIRIRLTATELQGMTFAEQYAEKQEMEQNKRKIAETVISVCEEIHGLEPGQITAKDRHVEICDARSMATGVILHYYPTFGMQRLGTLMGGRDHTTILAQKVRNENISSVDKRYDNLYQRCLQKCWDELMVKDELIIRKAI